MKSLAVLFLLVCQVVVTAFEWPFNNAHSLSGWMQIQTTVGSQNYATALNVSLNNICQGLVIASNTALSNGFNPASSTTFKKTGTFSSSVGDEGVVGTDDFTISTTSGSKTIKQLSFNVVDKGACVDENKLSLSHTITNKDGNSNPNYFIDSLLKGEKEKIAVLVYDKIPPDNDPAAATSGKIVFGERPDVCKNWKSAPDVDLERGQTWNFKVDKFSVGKYAVDKPAESAHFSLESTDFNIPSSYLEGISKELGVDSDGKVSCGVTQNFTVSVNGFNLVIIPDDYLSGKKGNPKEKCTFRVNKESDDDNFELSIRLLSRYCVLFDYGKNEVAIADRSDYKAPPSYTTAKPPNSAAFHSNVLELILLVCIVLFN